MRVLLVVFVFIFAQICIAGVTKSKCSIGTSAFMLANLDQDTSEPPKFYQLNFAYQLTGKDIISVEAITWKYYAPLGAPLSVSDTDKYPGSVTGQGIGLAYQRFLWDEFYSAIHATWLDQEYKDTNDLKIGKGSQLFLAFRFGYRHTFSSDTFFVEPSFAITHWPVNKGLPSSFKEKEDKWSDFTVEPGLHIGFLF